MDADRVATNALNLDGLTARQKEVAEALAAMIPADGSTVYAHGNGVTNHTQTIWAAGDKLHGQLHPVHGHPIWFGQRQRIEQPAIGLDGPQLRKARLESIVANHESMISSLRDEIAKENAEIEKLRAEVAEIEA